MCGNDGEIGGNDGGGRMEGGVKEGCCVVQNRLVMKFHQVVTTPTAV